MKNFVSIVTLTKNRAPLLKECLISLQRQTQQLDELVIVDNGSTDETQEVIEDFKRALPVRSVRTTSHGYPKLYNTGIAAARGNWLVLFDDDCVASAGWFAAIKNSISAFPRAVIQGKTLSIPKNNIYAEIMQDHYLNWIASNAIGKKGLRTFDNKNLCIPRWVIRTQGLFDESLTRGSEDIELGVRYHRAGIPILYEPKILAYHHERTTFMEFMRQHVRIARSERLVDRNFLHEDRIHMIPTRRIFLHMRSALLREWRYLRDGRLFDAMRLPILYIVLVCVRIYGYTIKSL